MAFIVSLFECADSHTNPLYVLNEKLPVASVRSVSNKQNGDCVMQAAPTEWLHHAVSVVCDLFTMQRTEAVV